jgi:hypothetical protein
MSFDTAVILLLLAGSALTGRAFVPPQTTSRAALLRLRSCHPAPPLFVLRMSLQEDNSLTSSEEMQEEVDDGKAMTGTVNERLLAELEDAARQEKYGSRSAMSKSMGVRSRKSDQEREAAIEEARNLNGVNPVVAITGSLFALAMAAGLWGLTNWLAEWFFLHPTNSDVYFVTRASSVVRNIVMGLSSLASGFFGVTGLGIFLLGIRVAYGVAKGELDPTPIKSKSKDGDVEAPNVWDLMMNKKPGRRR